MSGKSFQYTLLAEGTSDDALLPILDWLIRQSRPKMTFNRQRADFDQLPALRDKNVPRIEATIQLYQPDVLFLHKDADRDGLVSRRQQIQELIQEAKAGFVVPPTICVVPVRMTEAWLLFDEASIRRAAGNPNGRVPLNLPRIQVVEGIADPKDMLTELLKTASEFKGRRLRQFRPTSATINIANSIDDFSPLRQLEAFQLLEAEVFAMLDTLFPTEDTTI